MQMPALSMVFILFFMQAGAFRFTSSLKGVGCAEHEEKPEVVPTYSSLSIPQFTLYLINLIILCLSHHCCNYHFLWKMLLDMKISSTCFLGCNFKLVSFNFLMQLSTFTSGGPWIDFGRAVTPALSLKCVQALFPQLLCKGLFRLLVKWG